MLGRRSFLQTLFASPAVVAESRARQEQELADKLQSERVAEILKAKELGVAPAELKPRCQVCDTVLVNGKCQHTKKCNFCTNQKLLADIPGHHKYYEVPIVEENVYTHIVEDKCVVCNNAPFIHAPIRSWGSMSSCHYIGTCAVPYNGPHYDQFGNFKS